MNSEMANASVLASLEREQEVLTGFSRTAKLNELGLAETSAIGIQASFGNQVCGANDSAGKCGRCLACAYDREAVTLLVMAYRITRDQSDAEDARQSAYIGAMTSRERVKNWASWLNVATRNAALDIRRKRRQQVDPDMAGLVEGSHSTKVENRVLSAEVKQILRRDASAMRLVNAIMSEGSIGPDGHWQDGPANCGDTAIAHWMGVSRNTVYLERQRIRALFGVASQGPIHKAARWCHILAKWSGSPNRYGSDRALRVVDSDGWSNVVVTDGIAGEGL